MTQQREFARPSPVIPPRIAATRSPLALKERGSIEWCWQVLETLKSCYERLENNWRDVEKFLKDIEDVEAWSRVPPDKPYGSLEALLKAELGRTEIQFRHELATAKLRDQPGRPRKNASNTRILTPGKSLGARADIAYILARLERDERHDLLTKIEHGHLSVHQAAVTAGYRRPTFSAPYDPIRLAAILRKRLAPAQLAILIAHLSGDA